MRLINKKLIYLLLLIALFSSVNIYAMVEGRTYLNEEEDHFKYQIKTGDTLSQLSSRFGVASGELTDLNPKLDEDNLVVGDEILIKISNDIDYYVVQPGDTLWSISRQTDFPLQDIIEYNNISNPDLLYPNEVIILPEDRRSIESNLYFLQYTQDDAFLVAEKRDIPIGSYLYRSVLNELIKGPTKREDAFMPIPKETEILSVSVNQEGVAQINFSQEIKGAGVGAAGEGLLIMAIVNTLTEFREIESVQILIENRVDSIGGHIELDSLYQRGTEFIKYE